MKTWPLRWRIAVLSALASALALLTFTTIVAINLYSEQVEAIDTRLAAIARLVRIDPTATNGFNRDAFSALAADPQSRGDAPLFGFALLRTGDGRVIQSEPSALGTGGTFRLDGAKPFSREIDGTKLRFASFTWGEQTLLLAASLEPADESVQDLLGSAALALPIVLLVVMGGQLVDRSSRLESHRCNHPSGSLDYRRSAWPTPASAGHHRRDRAPCRSAQRNV